VTALTLISYVVGPLVIVTVIRRTPKLSGINPIIPAYVLGLLLSAVVPHSPELAGTQETISSAMVALSIPLMLFSVDLKTWPMAGRRALLSLGLAVVSIVVAVTVGHLVFRERLAESANMAGLLVGVYSGGTPNLAAIRTALNIDTSLYLTVHTVDILVSAVYILLIVTVGSRLFRRLLPRPALAGPAERRETRREQLDFRDIIRRDRLKQSGMALTLAIGIVVLGLAISVSFRPELQTVTVILAITTLALAATLLPGVNDLEPSFKMGELLILVFAVVVGSMADPAEILATSPSVIGYVSIAVFGSLTLHLILARLFRVDPETVMVTSVAAICSPPFVGMVAPSVKNPQIIAAGITTGIVGYAIGNYLGVATSWMLRTFL
jgi:uncharacterized membrane protein